MTDLRYSGGPKDGETYHLDPGQPVPLAIKRKEWVQLGHYQLKGEILVWVERKG